MTKMNIFHNILDYDYKSLADRLDKLVEQDRITTGAAYFVYDPYQWYSHRKASELCSKAAKSTDFTRYLKRLSTTEWSVMWQMFQEDEAKTLAFIQEQEALPFDQTQKQVLIQKGEL